MSELPPDHADDAELEAFWASNEGRSLADLLAEDAAWIEPPAELEERVVAAIERAAADEPGKVIDLAAHRERRSQRARTILPWAVAAAAAAAAVVIAVKPFASTSTQFTAALAGAPLAPKAHGTADLSSTATGFKIELHVEGLPRAPKGFFYQAWVKGTRGLVTIGTFHTGGTVTLWSGVDPARYPTMTVTLEPEDGNPASSGQKVLVGPITRR
jgi:hypothetical protein